MNTAFSNSHPSVKRFAKDMRTDTCYLQKVANVIHKAGYCHATQTQLTYDVNNADTSAIASTLRSYGLVCLTNVVDSASLATLNGHADTLFKRINEGIASQPQEQYGDIDDVAWQKNLSVANNFNQLVDYPKPMVNVRGSAGSDNGMLDVFNVQKLAVLRDAPGFQQLYNFFVNGLAHQLIRKISSFTFSNIQLYENRSVTNTRGFHIDNIFGTFKVFVYLTDVKSCEDGPYCYVPGSHRMPYLHRLELRHTQNRGIRTRDMLSSQFLPHLKIFAPKGTVIISNQTGIHRGHPQKMGGKRRVLVANYSDHVKVGRNY